MTTTDGNWGVQASYRFGANGVNLLNVRAEDPYALAVQLAGVADGEVLTSITTVSALLEAGANLQPVTAPQGVPAALQSPAERAVTNAWAPPPVPPQPPTPTGVGQVQPPQCPHGTRVFRQGVGAKGPWQAYFCPTPKDTPGQCAPEWIK